MLVRRMCSGLTPVYWAFKNPLYGLFLFVVVVVVVVVIVCFVWVFWVFFVVFGGVFLGGWGLVGVMNLFIHYLFIYF